MQFFIWNVAGLMEKGKETMLNHRRSLKASAQRREWLLLPFHFIDRESHTVKSAPIRKGCIILS